MLGFKLLTGTLAVCHGFTVPMPDHQSVLDIDIHINTGTHDDMAMGSKDMMMMHSDDMPVNTDATLAQWNRGVVASTGVDNYASFFLAGVGANNEAYATVYNSSWLPSYKGFYNLGGQFNRSLAVLSFRGTVYITGTTRTGNLVLKNFADKGVLYPKTKSWILLAEETIEGTPAIASHDNKTISVVVRQKDGSLVHEIYDPETDGQSSATIPGMKFASNPALLVRPGKKLQVYATDSSGQMHFSEWDGGKSWTAWTPLGGDFVGDPATAWLEAQGDVWSVGKDGSVSARYFSDKDCFSATWATLDGVGCLNTGSVHYWGKGFKNADFFCQTKAEIYYIRRDGDKLTSTKATGGTYAAPSTWVYWHGGKAYSDLIVMGMNAGLYRNQRSADNDWSGWEQLGGTFQS